MKKELKVNKGAQDRIIDDLYIKAFQRAIIRNQKANYLFSAFNLGNLALLYGVDEERK